MTGKREYLLKLEDAITKSCNEKTWKDSINPLTNQFKDPKMRAKVS